MRFLTWEAEASHMGHHQASIPSAHCILKAVGVEGSPTWIQAHVCTLLSWLHYFAMATAWRRKTEVIFSFGL